VQGAGCRVQGAGCRVQGLGDNTDLGFRRLHELDARSHVDACRTHVEFVFEF
jgi:hypothetical protein